MEIISYISPTDGFVHYVFNNSMGIPFFLWVLVLFGCCSLIYLVLKHILGGVN